MSFIETAAMAITGHIGAGVCLQYWANKSEPKIVSPEGSLESRLKGNGLNLLSYAKNNYHKIIGTLITISPDFDFGLQKAYSYFVDTRYSINDWHTMTYGYLSSIPDLPKIIADGCQFLCHRSVLTHGVSGVAAASALGYYLYSRASGGDKKYAKYGVLVYGAQIALSHLFFDVFQGYLKPFYPLDITLHVPIPQVLPANEQQYLATLFPVLIAITATAGLKTFYHLKKNYLTKANPD